MNEHDDSHMKPDDGLSRLYRAAPQAEPSAALDAVILDAARNTAEGRPSGRPAKGGMQRWRLPFALAATVVLSVAVTTMVRDELPPGTVAIPLPDAALPRPAAESATANAVPGTAPQARDAESAARPAYEPAAAGMASVQAKAAAPAVAPMPLRERMDLGAQPTQPALQAAPAMQGEVAADAAASARANDEDKAVSIMAAPRALDKHAFSSSLREEAVAGASVADEKSPDAWIADIRELKHAGRGTEAADRLVDFRKRFPDYKLPDDLK